MTQMEPMTLIYHWIPTFFQKDSGGNNENKIFVGGLGSNITEEDLRAFFSSLGKV